MLIHDALVEYLLSHDTEVRNGEINKYIHNLTTIQEDKSSLLQKQFEVYRYRFMRVDFEENLKLV